MKNEIEPIELEEFIKSTIEQIEKGVDLEKRWLKDAIEFDVSVSKTKKLGGGIKVYVASGEGTSEKEQIAKIKFSVRPNYPQSKQSAITRPKIDSYK